MLRVCLTTNRSMGQRGYTLIELLLYVAMIGILLSAVTAFFGMAADARIKSQSINEVNQQGTFAMDYMVQTIRNATSITAPATGTSSTNGLTVVVPTGSLSPTVFSLSSGVLQVKEGAGALVPLTSNDVQVTSLTVTNLTRSGTSGILQIAFTIARVNTSGRNEYDYQKTFTTSVAVRP
jgi:prepilin-type N-terminal cleavage/methylation domain-containing protein